MGIVSKATAAAAFETGDRPDQQQFADFIDSAVFIPSAGAVGFIEIESTASSTNRAVGALGVQLVGAETTASAQGHLGLTVGAVGDQLLSAETTASAQDQLGLTVGAVGEQLLSAGTTASAQNQLDGGTVGIQIFTAITTASARSHLAIVSAADPTKEFTVYPTDLDVAGTGTFPFITNVGDFIPLVVANTSLTHFHFFVPNDFTSLTDAVVVMIPDATETIQWDVTTDFGASGEASTANSDSDLNATLAVTADELSEADVSPALTAIAANDYVGMAFASDTDNIRPFLLRFKYT